MTRPPLVLIEWEDAYSGDHDWFELEKIRDFPLIIYSAGFEVHSTEERITLAANYQPESEMGPEKIADLMTIPAGMVRKRTVLKA